MQYTLRYKKSAYRELHALPKNILCRIIAALEELKSNPLPNGVRKLHNVEDLYRLRISQYRVLYRFRKQIEIITVVRVRHRKDAYRSW